MTFITKIEIGPSGRRFTELTLEIYSTAQRSGIRCGICSVFVCHTSASLIICENADRRVLLDLERFMERTVPDGDPLFLHTAEGPDDMPAHIRNVLTSSDITMPVRNGKVRLGVWQGVHLWEHRRYANQRTIEITIVGER